MSSPKDNNPKDAITHAETTGEAPSEHSTAFPPTETSQKRPNAFAELMSSSKKTKPPSKKPTAKKGWDPRDGLEIYITHPETNPEGLVVEYDDDFVVIHDKYPKASVHLLLIPRNPALYFQHPLHQLSTDAPFLAQVRARVARVEHLVASELRRQFGRHSAADAPYQRALDDMMGAADDAPSLDRREALLPPGRDWGEDVVAGVHTHPSMNHLHIHVLSRDMHSPSLKHKKHYLSFNSSFMVKLDELPLEEGSPRFHPGNWPNWDMVCWRCGKDFGNRFAALKAHLEDEFERWKKE